MSSQCVLWVWRLRSRLCIDESRSQTMQVACSRARYRIAATIVDSSSRYRAKGTFLKTNRYGQYERDIGRAYSALQRRQVPAGALRRQIPAAHRLHQVSQLRRHSNKGRYNRRVISFCWPTRSGFNNGKWRGAEGRRRRTENSRNSEFSTRSDCWWPRLTENLFNLLLLGLIKSLAIKK